MIEAKATAEPLKTEKIADASEKASYKNIRHAAFSISKASKESIQKVSRSDGTPSAAGTPPHTRGRGRQSFKKAIFVDAEKDSAIIGPRHSWVGESMAAHEFGETFRGINYDERPTLGPALEASVTRFADQWQNSIGE